MSRELALSGDGNQNGIFIPDQWLQQAGVTRDDLGGLMMAAAGHPQFHTPELSLPKRAAYLTARTAKLGVDAAKALGHTIVATPGAFEVTMIVGRRINPAEFGQGYMHMATGPFSRLTREQFDALPDESREAILREAQGKWVLRIPLAEKPYYISMLPRPMPDVGEISAQVGGFGENTLNVRNTVGVVTQPFQFLTAALGPGIAQMEAAATNAAVVTVTTDDEFLQYAAERERAATNNGTSAAPEVFAGAVQGVRGAARVMIQTQLGVTVDSITVDLVPGRQVQTLLTAGAEAQKRELDLRARADGYGAIAKGLFDAMGPYIPQLAGLVAALRGNEGGGFSDARIIDST